MNIVWVWPITSVVYYILLYAISTFIKHYDRKFDYYMSRKITRKFVVGSFFVGIVPVVNLIVMFVISLGEWVEMCERVSYLNARAFDIEFEDQNK